MGFKLRYRDVYLILQIQGEGQYLARWVYDILPGKQSWVSFNRNIYLCIRECYEIENLSHVNISGSVIKKYKTREDMNAVSLKRKWLSLDYCIYRICQLCIIGAWKVGINEANLDRGLFRGKMLLRTCWFLLSQLYLILTCVNKVIQIKSSPTPPAFCFLKLNFFFLNLS